MTEDRWLRWQAEAAGTSPLPSIGAVLLAGLLAWLLAMTLAAQPRSVSSAPGRDRVVDTPVCVELARLQRHGVTSGAHWRDTRAACRAARKAAVAP
jgi:hypothetical protein